MLPSFLVSRKPPKTSIRALQMTLPEHLEKMDPRLFFCLKLIIMSIAAGFTNIKNLVPIFQSPAVGVKLLQYAPSEYFFDSVKDLHALRTLFQYSDSTTRKHFIFTPLLSKERTRVHGPINIWIVYFIYTWGILWDIGF